MLTRPERDLTALGALEERLRFLACLVLVLWLAPVVTSLLAGLLPDDTRPLARAYGAARPWLLTLPVIEIMEVKS